MTDKGTPPLRSVRLPSGGPVDETSGYLIKPPRLSNGRAVLLAHGAGANCESPFLVSLARALATLGYTVLAFDYPYQERARREKRRFPPDRLPTLMAAHRAALAELRKRLPKARTVLCGKSMGGRVASYLAAESDPGFEADKLVFVGYPLHPAGRPDRLRSDHFPGIRVPTLFLQGDRDALGSVEALRTECAKLAGPLRLRVIAGADHDFRVAKQTKASREELIGRLATEIADWDVENR